ncbi:MAG: hypothetical protein PVG78_15465 [Desulfobacterales bacterium]|jgi:hypothetical protein
MKSIYFLCLNALHFVPYAFGLLKNDAATDPEIRRRYQWHEPFHVMAPMERIVEKIAAPDVLCASC